MTKTLPYLSSLGFCSSVTVEVRIQWYHNANIRAKHTDEALLMLFLSVYSAGGKSKWWPPEKKVSSAQSHIQDQESIFVLRSKVEHCELQNRSHSPGKVLICACTALFFSLCLYLFLKSLFVDVILRQQRGPQDLQAYLVP